MQLTANNLVLAPFQPFSRDMHSHVGSWPTAGMPSVLNREVPSVTHTMVSQPSVPYSGAHTFVVSVGSHVIPLPPTEVGNGVFFFRFGGPIQ